ncbi:MAG: type II toxin-antitoxin system HicA family toxin [Pseudomonadota bacterium]
MADFYRQVCQLLRNAGYVQIPGGKGSHQKWYNAERDSLLIVPYNLKKRHTANGIIKDAGLKKKF